MTVDEILFKFIRIALGKEQDHAFPKELPWHELLQLADAQKVTPVVMDGIATSEVSMPRAAKMEWIGRTAMCQQVYAHHERQMTALAEVYAQAGIRMMVLKGWGLSLDYPVPAHRPSGDLDIWTFGKRKEADALVASKGVSVDNSHHHHSVFQIKGLFVENHYDFVNVYVRRSNRKIENRLKELVRKSPTERKVSENLSVYLPSSDFNALFLLCHTASHFVSTNMNLRQVLDWGLFMERHHDEIDWKAYLSFVKSIGMYPFFVILNTICTEQIGIDENSFHGHTNRSSEAARVLQDMLHPRSMAREDGSLLTSLRVKPARWWRNRWKRRLCYTDSLASTFCYGVYAKLLKPKHFLH